MKPIYTIAGTVAVLFAMSIADIPYLSGTLISDAYALRGRGAAFAVGAAVGSSRASQQQAAPPPPPPAPAPQQAAPPPPAPAPQPAAPAQQ
jgi:hypothetical protein